MENVEINVFGKTINIVPMAVVVKVEKMNDKYVYLKKRHIKSNINNSCTL